MAALTAEELAAHFQAIKTVFPGIELSEIHLETETGMAFIKFSKEEVENQDFSLIPDGKYTAQICNHDWKKTKSDGHMLVLTLEITGPTSEGRKLWDNLNLDCASEDAQKIALRSYKSICGAVGAEAYYDRLFEVEDADQMISYLDELPGNLYGTDILVTVGTEKGKGDYPDKNKIKFYAPAKDAAKPVAGKATPSWVKK